MRFLSRVFFPCILFFFIVFGLALSLPQHVAAQTTTQTSLPTNTYETSLAEGVPYNQHNRMQAQLIEFMLAIQCQITGIDLANPGYTCLGLDVTTGKLGYAPREVIENGQLQNYGILGMLNRSISAMFIPMAGSQEYIRYLASDFGVVKSAIAAPASGFDGLTPVLEMWKSSRDLAYFILIIAFIFIGIGVMLRIHIDPRTVMTVQNQIPRVIICIILITFSYAFAGLLIDVMWTVTYMGVNTLTNSVGSNPQVGGSCTGNPNYNKNLSNTASAYILSNPIFFFNETFMEPGCATGGILDLSGNVGDSMRVIQTDLLIDLLGLDCEFEASWNPLDWIGDAVSCVASGAVYGLIQWLIALIWILIALVIILIALFRIWFALLKAYALIFMYVVLGPLWIVMGLLPKKPLGFEKWVRVLFANLAIFPATVFLLLFARILTDKFNSSETNIFVPPLVGNPGAGTLGGLIAFAILLATPSILDTLREKLGVPPSKAFQGAVNTFNAGRQAAMTPAKKGWQHLNKRDSQGFAIGPVARRMDKITGGMAGGVSKLPGMGWVGRQHAISEAEKAGYGGGRRFIQAEQEYGKDYNAERQAAYARRPDETRKEAKARGKEFDNKYKDVLAYAQARNAHYREEDLPPQFRSQAAASQAPVDTSKGAAVLPGTTKPSADAQTSKIQLTIKDKGKEQTVHFPVGASTSVRTVRDAFNGTTRNTAGILGKIQRQFESDGYNPDEARAMRDRLLDAPVEEHTEFVQKIIQQEYDDKKTQGNVQVKQFKTPETKTPPKAGGTA